MGKSTVAAMFAAEGVPVFDADAVVHRLQRGNRPLIEVIEKAFPGTTTADSIDRVALGKAVFADPRQLARLEAIMHPAVAVEREAFLARHRRAPLVILDIPLLLEKGRSFAIDRVIVVSASDAIQRERALVRTGMTPEKLAHIQALQMPDAEKRLHADYVILTEGSLAETRARVREVIACLIDGKG